MKMVSIFRLDMVDAWSQAASRFRTSTAGIWEYYQEEVVAQKV
jgi:hypothetical protein